LLVRSEEGHRDILRGFESLLKSGKALATTSYVVLEVIALLQNRIGLEPVRDFNDHLLPLISVHWVTEPLHQRGMARLVRESRRTLSLVDCVSFEFMASEGIREAFALDRHFREEGIRVFPATRE
jgi:predicted nucleic acid-binding protein